MVPDLAEAPPGAVPGTPHKVEAATRPKGHILRGTSWESCMGAIRLRAPTLHCRVLGLWELQVCGGLYVYLCVCVSVCKRLCGVWRGSHAQEASQ